MRPTCSLSFVHEGLMLLGLYEVYAHSLLGLVRVRRGWRACVRARARVRARLKVG